MAYREQHDSSGYESLKASVRSGKFAKLYFFFGEERYLMEYYLAAMKRKLIAGGMADFNFRRFTLGEATPDGVRSAVEVVPMMAEHTLVQIDDFNPFDTGKDERRAWAEIFEDLPDYCHVVFCFDAVPFTKKSRAEEKSGQDKEKDRLPEVVKKYGCEVEFAKQSPSELAEWITRHFRAAGKKISGELCRYLIFLTDGTMTSLAQEIEKIAAYSAADTIVKADIDALVTPTLNAVVFDVCDALAQGRCDTALSGLRDLLALQQEPIPILGAIGSHFRRLNLARLMTAAGRTAADVAAAVGTQHDGYARKLVSQSSRFSEEYLAYAAVLCCDADLLLKRSPEDGGTVLTDLIVRLAQEAKG